MVSLTMLLGTQVVQAPVIFVQYAQLLPHERQVLMVLFKYLPVGQTASTAQVLLVLL